MTSRGFRRCAILGWVVLAGLGGDAGGEPSALGQPLLANPNGRDGLRQLGGKALYEINDSVITGTSVAAEPNSFLATEKEYGDFELSYEFKVDPKLNSGVQIRSHSRPEYNKGQVHGYQAEIDPSPRAWTAGIYEEGRRGWLQNLTANEPARQAFKQGEWNTVRIRAHGDSIRTWLNGVPAADLRDAGETTGFIAFQVHGVGNEPAKIGTQVQWRAIRLHDLGAHEWKPLFNGTSLAGWSATPGGQWEVRDGAIRGTSPASDPRHGLLLSNATHGDFTLRLKFKVTKGNSGFYFRAQRVDDPVTVHGIQAEICENDDTGGLYDTGGRGWIAQPDKAWMAKEKVCRHGEWNEMWVSAHGARLVVHVNGHQTVDFLDPDQKRSTGHLGLQLHGSQDMDVEFKEMELLVPKP
ncbi:MAG: DUF1080 domain-containing protein [Verrucomicrobiales bacterium]